MSGQKKKIKEIHTLTFDSYEAAVIANNKHFQTKNSEQLALINKIMEILDQLDEPEVTLDRAFEKVAESYPMTKGEIWRHLERLEAHGGKVTYNEPEVLSQELPVIPKFVADFIEEVKPDNSLRVAFGYIAQRKRDNHDDELAFWVEEGNSETFARAWLDGYTVKKEQKYYVMNNENELLLSKNKDDEVITYSQYYPQVRKVLSDLSHYQLTEQEIKDYDERYMSFAKPI